MQEYPFDPRTVIHMREIVKQESQQGIQGRGVGGEVEEEEEGWAGIMRRENKNGE